MNINNIHLSVDGNVCIATIESKAYRVNDLFYRVLRGMKSGLSIEDSVNMVSVETGTDYDGLFNKFNTFIKAVQQAKNKSYIRCKRVVIKGRWVNEIAHSLTFFYSRCVLTVLLITSIMANVAYLGLNYNYLGRPSRYTIIIVVMVFLGYLLSLIIHEIGHATATASVGKEAKEIGFGFYVIFPVFYTDVTSVWCMGKKERILVSVGGVYFQLMVNAIVIGLIFMFPQSALINAMNGLVISNILVIGMSMTPFFRNDGYWILSDYWSIPNLQKKSDYAIFHPCARYDKGCNNDKYKLLLFGVANNLFRSYVFVRLVLNLYENLIGITSLTTKNSILFVIVSITISLVGMYWILMCYYKSFRYGNQKRY